MASSLSFAIGSTSGKKRSRKNQKYEALGATEFVSILNGEDPCAMLDALRGFVAICRNERNLALGIENKKNDNNEETEDEDEEEEEEGKDVQKDDDDDDAPTKRRKKGNKNNDEDWKQDTANYNVPFVGTSVYSVTTKRDRGRIVKGQWPTGLMRAYLEKSPLATEFTITTTSHLWRHTMFAPSPQTQQQQPKHSSKSKQKQKKQKQKQKLSVALTKQYLCALSELITCDIPLDRLCNDESISIPTTATTTTATTNPYSNLISQILKTNNRCLLGDMIHLLKVETNHGKGGNKNLAAGGNVGATANDCGPLAPHVLHVLCRLASTSSLSTVRHVARVLEQHLSQEPLVIRFLIKQQEQQQQRGPLPSSAADQQQHATSTSTSSARSKARIALLELTNVLLSYADPVLINCLADSSSLPSYSANKDGGVKKHNTFSVGTAPNHSGGLLYWVCREGFIHLNRQQQGSKSLLFLTSILNWIMTHLLSTTTTSSPPGRNNMGSQLTPYRRRVLLHGLLSKEFLLALVQIALWTPMPKDITTLGVYDNDVIMEEENDNDESNRSLGQQQQQLARCSQQMMFVLLTSQNSSPFLLEFAESRQRREYRQSPNAPQNLMVRMLHSLFDGAMGTTASKGSLLPAQNFVVHCLETSPALVPFFYDHDATSLLLDPKQEQANPFATVQRLHFVSKLLHRQQQQQHQKDPIPGLESKDPEQLILVLVPKSFKAQLLSRMLKTSNALVVAEILRFYICVLRRLATWSKSLKTDSRRKGSGSAPDFAQQFLNLFLQQHMSDVHSFLSILQSSGPFSPAKKSNPVLFTRAADVVREAALLLPAWINEKKQDWLLKLVPPSSEDDILRSSVYLQCKLFDCLYTLLKVQDDDSAWTKSWDSLSSLFSILLRTRSKVAHQKTRAILLLLLSKRDSAVAGPEGSSSFADYLRHEASCWVDGMTKDCLDEFLQHLNKSSSLLGIRGWVECANLCQDYVDAPEVPFQICSALLLYSLKQLGEASPAFRALVCQVTARSIMFQIEPSSLVSIASSRLNSFLSNVDTTTDLDAFKSLQAYTHMIITTENKVNEQAIKNLLDSFLSSNSWLKNFLDHDGPRYQSRKIGPTESVADHANATRYLGHFLSVSTRNDSHSHTPAIEFYRRVVVALSLYRDLPFEMDSLVNLGQQITRQDKRQCAAFWLSLRSCNYDGELPGLASVYSVSPVSTTESKETFLTWYVTAGFCPAKDLQNRLCIMLASCMAGRANEVALFPSVTLHINCLSEKARQELIDCDKGLVELMFHAWSGLGLDEAFSVLVSLQRALGLILETQPHLSRTFCMLVESRPAEEVVSRALRLEHDGADSNERSGVAFSELLVKADYVRYAGAYMKLLASSEYPTMFLSSKALLPALRHVEELGLNQLAKKDILTLLAGNLKDLPALFKCLSCFCIDTLALIPPEILRGLCRHVITNLDNTNFEGSIGVGVLVYRVYNKANLTFGDGNVVGEAAVASLSSEIDRQLRLFKKSPSSSRFDRVCAIFDTYSLLWTCLLGKGSIDIISNQNVSNIGVIVRNCLKHGLGTASEASSEQMCIRSKCLELVLATVSSVSSRHLSQVLGKSFGALIFQWVTSHSNFAELVAQDSSPLLKLLLLRILVSCLSEAEDNLFDTETWNSVLSGFKAGVSVADSLARRFLLRYSQLAPPESSCCFMNQLRWGSRATSDTVARGTWEWLPSWLELSRINPTLKRFPLDDTLDLPIDGFGGDGTQCGHETLSPEEHTAPFEDKRYSPGFLLPLVLAALEEPNSGAGNEDKTGFTAARGELSGPFLLHKLCDKGALALSIASMCCDCPNIRKVAISILYHTVRLIHTEEARKMSSWRERPQVALLLDSVRRGIAKEVADTANDAGSSKVPTISPPCAIFLAKACFILTSPGDAMYPRMNRYFLRIAEDHGAFQDFHRLPAFILLFCSSALDEGQASLERCWAIETLRDSFIDERCYGPLLSCHGLELLMTRIEALASHPNDHEFEVIISAITRVAECCGPKALSSLACRVGLVSWLSSLNLGRRILLYASQRTRWGVLNLMAVVVERSRTVLTNTELGLMLQGVLQATLQSHVDHRGGNQRSISLSDWRSLQRFLSQSSFCFDFEEAEDSKSLVVEGVHLETAIALLEELREQDAALRDGISLSFCNLPLYIDPNESRTGAEFCIQMLHALEVLQEQTKENCSKILKCILRVKKRFSGAELDGHNGFKEHVHSARFLCCQWAECRALWRELDNKQQSN